MPVRFAGFLLLCVMCAAGVAGAQTTTTQQPAPAPTVPGQTTPGQPTPGQTTPGQAKPVQPGEKPVPSGPGPQGYTSSQMRLERVTGTHWRFNGQVELDHESGVKFFADEADLYTDTHQLVARGNVVFANAEGRISAERLEFNTESQTGTFYQATGVMSLGPTAERVQFGNQDPDVYFYGDTVSKIGERKYRITRGGFTTCVQPTPRWEMTSGTLTLNLKDYAILKHTVLRVKGVPIFYLPWAYYPMDEDDRSTGFLLPTYGASTLRGQAISNAFFWAINRSHDLTFFHDWFTRAGQGYGSEYRYVTNPQSSGSFTVYRFSQKATEFREDNVTGTLPENESFKVRAYATQTLARGLRARARVDYFSDVITQQLYQQNFYDASQRSRIIQTALSGAWGPYNTTVAYDQTEVFSDEHRSSVYGGTPRITGGIAPTELFGAPIYGSVSGEFANLPYRTEIDGETVERDDFGLTRIDFAPLLRVPFSRWTFLTLNSSVGYRLTHYSESRTLEGLQIPEPYTRSFFDLRADIVGPVLTKIWDASAESSAERYKHVIEPTFGIQQTTPIENFERTPILSTDSDFVVGSAGRFTYGLTNRLLRRDRPREGRSSSAREFLSIALQQTYYSESQASRFDTTYQSSSRDQDPAALSPVALIVRYSPTMATTATARAEYDVNHGLGLQSLSASGNVYVGRQSLSATLSRRKFDEIRDAETFLSAGGTASVLDGRLSGTYSINWDITKSYIVTQTLATQYFAQCCGFGVEFQKMNYSQLNASFPVDHDRRINFSFTLAGLGTFSNFFGAFGGSTGR